MLKRYSSWLITIILLAVYLTACQSNQLQPTYGKESNFSRGRTSPDNSNHVAMRAQLDYEPYSDIEKMKEDAEWIFLGTVEKVTAPVDMILFYMSDSKRTPFYYPNTVTELRVDRVLKGDLQVGMVVEISQPGVQDGADFFMINEVLLERGAQGIIFTTPHREIKSDPPTTLRFEQGVFKVEDARVEPNFVQDGLFDNWELEEVLMVLEKMPVPSGKQETTPSIGSIGNLRNLGVLESDYSAVNVFWLNDHNLLLALTKTLPENGHYVEYGQLLFFDAVRHSQQVVYLGPMTITAYDNLLYSDGQYVYQGSQQLVFMNEDLIVQDIISDLGSEKLLRLAPNLKRSAQLVGGDLVITELADDSVIATHSLDGYLSLAWAPDSSRLAFVSADQSRVIVLSGDGFTEKVELRLGLNIPLTEISGKLLNCSFGTNSDQLILMIQQGSQMQLLKYQLDQRSSALIARSGDLRILPSRSTGVNYINGGNNTIWAYSNSSSSSIQIYQSQWPILAADYDRNEQQAFIVEYEHNQQQLYLLDIAVPSVPDDKDIIPEDENLLNENVTDETENGDEEETEEAVADDMDV